MSPRLQYLPIARRTHHALKGDRNRIDPQRQPTSSGPFRVTVPA